MSINEKATTTVEINGEQARQELDLLKREAVAWRNKMVEASEAGDTKGFKKAESELRKVNAQMRTMQKSAVDINNVLNNLSTSGPKDLQRALKAINAELNSGRVQRGSEEWKKYNIQAKQVSAELRKINAEQRESVGWFSRFNNGLSKWGGTITSIIAGLTGVTLALSKMRSDRNDKEESADNLKALTGLDDESIGWLTKQAEVLSTTMDKSGLRVKQSSRDILEAYMLVGSAKPELLTSKEALNSVTIEAMRLSAAAKMDLKSAVDAVTISMNQYSAGADQASKYTNILAAGSKFGSANVQSQAAAIVKAGVAASGANVSIEQLVGSIEMLGEKGIKDEVAGTGLKTFFLRLQTGVKETNPAIVGFDKALDNLKKKQMSPAAIKKMFGDEGYSVAKILIDNVQKVKEYTKAVTGTNVAVEQAAINSDNAAAKSAQMKNKLKEVGIELMEKLNPSINVLGNGFTRTLAVILPLIDFLQKYGDVIIGMLIPLGTYITLTKLQAYWTKHYTEATVASIVAQKLKDYWTRICTAGEYLYVAAIALYTGATTRATLATKKFFLTLSLNPFTAVIAILGALTYAVYKLATSTKQAKAGVTDFARQSERMNEINKKAGESIMEQKSKIDFLLLSIHKENLANEQRQRAIKKLQQIIPAYNAEISKEGSILKENKKAVDDYIKSIEKEMRVKGTQEAVTQLYKDKVPFEMAKRKAKDEIDDITEKNRYSSNPDPTAEYTKKILIGTVQFNQQELDKINSDIKYLNEQIQLDMTELNKDKDGDGGTGELDDEAKKKRIKQWETETEQFKAHTASMYSIGKVTKQEHDDSILQSDKDLLQKKMTLYDKKSKEYNSLLIQLNQMEIKTQEECNKETHEEIESGIKAEKRALLEQYADQTLSKKTYEEGIIRLDRDALVRKRDVYTSGTKEFNDYQKQLDDFDAQDKEKRYSEYENRLAEFRKEYQKKTLWELHKEELDRLDELLKVKAIKIEEYEKMKLAIENKYAGLGAEEPGIMQKASQKTTDILNRAKSKAKNTYTDEDKKKAEEGDPFFTMFGAEAKERKNILSILDKEEEDGVISHKEKLMAKAQLDGEYYAGLAEKMQAAYAVISAVTSAYSEYSQASQELEEAKINKKYDAEIKAAGNSSVKKKQIEERKEKELAKVKSKYADRTFAMNVSMGIAQTAIAAISAYTSALQIGPAGLILAPIAASMAVAAGMLQVATLKKQHEAAKQGYYYGGFTPSGRWDEEQGSVHSDEFIANRFAVRNKEIRPVLNLIDRAQKNNTIGSLKASDVSRAIQGNSSPEKEPGFSSGFSTGQESQDVQYLMAIVSQTASINKKLLERLNEPFVTVNSVDGPHGMQQAFDNYNGIQRNKSRHD